MPRIVVNPDDLDELAGALARAKAEVDTLGRRIDDYHAALGSERVRRGVERLTSNWSDVREKFTQELDTLGALVASAASEYRAAEEQVIAATRLRTEGDG